ncbi:MAG: hypothetical protein ACLRFR_01220, partial [Clostridia bacterium]
YNSKLPLNQEILCAKCSILAVVELKYAFPRVSIFKKGQFFWLNLALGVKFMHSFKGEEYERN